MIIYDLILTSKIKQKRKGKDDRFFTIEEYVLSFGENVFWKLLL